MNDQHPSPVSAIIPARNEEPNIAWAVASLAAQPEIREMIVADDQSEDRTPEILSQLQREYPKLRTLRLEDLPAGWLGKPHAAAEGAKLASGEWLLFTDADTTHLPGSLEALLKRAEREQADLLSISPGQLVETWWEKAVIPLVYAQLAKLYRFEEVNDPHSTVAAANGQYILIRRSVYNSVGGWAAVRDAMLDDVALAKRVKSAGGKIIFLPGARWAQTRMYRTFKAMWSGWTKNLFLLYDRDSLKLLSAAIYMALLGALPVTLLAAVLALAISLFRGRPHEGLPAAVLVLCIGAIAWRMRTYSRQIRALGFSRTLVVYLFLGAPLLALLLLNSWRAYRMDRGIEWKGRTYPAKGAL